MREPPAAVSDLAQHWQLGEFALTQELDGPGDAPFLIALLLGCASLAACLAGSPAIGVILALVSVPGVAVGAWWRRNARDTHRVLHCFQRGLVLRERDGQLSAYPWTAVKVTTHSGRDLSPKGIAVPYVHLCSADGKLQLDVGGEVPTGTIRRLMAN